MPDSKCFGDILNVEDYGSFGMLMVGRHGASGGIYRYGFQGQEGENEVSGEKNNYSYTFRMNDVRLGRFFSVDHLSSKYAYNSPYAFSENRVLDGVELEGLEVYLIHGTLGSFDGYASGFTNGEFQRIFGNSSVYQHSWSGANNTQARKDAATALIKLIKETHIEGEPITIVGHSHGGNVATYVMQELYNYYTYELCEEVTFNLVTLNTPVVEGGATLSAEAEENINHYQIFSINDKVIPEAGFNRTGIMLSGGETANIFHKPGGEKSYRAASKGSDLGRPNKLSSSADFNIGYRDQYFMKPWKGFDTRTWVTQHRGWLQDNYEQWAPQLQNAVFNNYDDRDGNTSPVTPSDIG